MTSESLQDFIFTPWPSRKGLLLSSYQGHAHDVHVPSEVQGQKVLAIGPKAFEKSSVVNLVLPDGIEEISAFAFASSPSLEKIVLPTTLRVLGAYAFAYDCALESIVLPQGVKVIAPFTFQNCTSLEKVILPPSLKEIQENAFLGCAALSEINFEDVALTKLGSHAFAGCLSLHGISLTLKGLSFSADSFAGLPKSCLLTFLLQKGKEEALPTHFYEVHAILDYRFVQYCYANSEGSACLALEQANPEKKLADHSLPEGYHCLTPLKALYASYVPELEETFDGTFAYDDNALPSLPKETTGEAPYQVSRFEEKDRAMWVYCSQKIGTTFFVEAANKEEAFKEVVSADPTLFFGAISLNGKLGKSQLYIANLSEVKKEKVQGPLYFQKVEEAPSSTPRTYFVDAPLEGSCSFRVIAPNKEDVRQALSQISPDFLLYENSQSYAKPLMGEARIDPLDSSLDPVTIKIVEK